MAITTNTVQLTNVLNQAFGADDITLEIASGAADYSNTIAAAALSSGPGHTGLLVLNYGNILNSAGVAIDFTANTGGTIINEPGGAIAGSAALVTGSSGLSIVNFGSMTGTDLVSAAVVMDTPAIGVVLDNRGIIFGHGEGVANLSHSGSNRISNSGVIDAQSYGIEASATAGLTTYIVNSGTIRGTTAVSSGSGGLVNLVNSGQIYGLITFLGLANDIVANSGFIPSQIHLGAGDDRFIGGGGRSGPLFGEAGQDHLSAGKSNDIVSGGPGNDTLTGGADRDFFLFDALLDASSNVDRITDFSVPLDTIELKHSVFTKTNPSGVLPASMFFKGAAAHDASDRVIYSPATGRLYYDEDGNGHAHAPVLFARLAAHLAPTHADFIVVA